ncbi:MAG: DEAD/DEAH box helicase [Pseudobdellovibrionaceae bacterium]
MHFELSNDQKNALNLLQSGENVFLTGGAGSGKSTVIRELMHSLSPKEMPVLASTGAASVLVGGRTFHSFFGLGIMDGGEFKTLEKARGDKRLFSRLRKVEGFILDEVSMISAAAFRTAEQIAKEARDSDLPWGGMRVITVGDFAQLPPVSKNSSTREWAFLDSSWSGTDFQICSLNHNHRTQDREFLDVLASVRSGKVDESVQEFLEKHVEEHFEESSGTRLFPLRAQAEAFNQKKLHEIDSEEKVFGTIYFGDERFVESLKKNSPIPENLVLKVGCEVLFVQNDSKRRWVNGSRGEILDISNEGLVVKLASGREVEVEKTTFGMQNADGNVIASGINFPVVLGYATTIHKSQGATLDEVWLDLRRLWEPGHAYVALSRLRSPKGLHLIGWNPKSILVDPRVEKFYAELKHRDI